MRNKERVFTGDIDEREERKKYIRKTRSVLIFPILCPFCCKKIGRYYKGSRAYLFLWCKNCRKEVDIEIQ